MPRFTRLVVDHSDFFVCGAKPGSLSVDIITDECITSLNVGAGSVLTDCDRFSPRQTWLLWEGRGVYLLEATGHREGLARKALPVACPREPCGDSRPGVSLSGCPQALEPPTMHNCPQVCLPPPSRVLPFSLSWRRPCQNPGPSSRPTLHTQTPCSACLTS